MTETFLSDAQRARIPAWLFDYVLRARCAGLLSLAPRLTFSQRRHAAKRTAVRGYPVPDDKPHTDGVFTHTSGAYAPRMDVLTHAARTLPVTNALGPEEHMRAWAAAGQALAHVPTATVAAAMLADAVSSAAPSTWRDLRAQLIADTAAHGVALDAAEQDALDTIRAWRETRIAALRGEHHAAVGAKPPSYKSRAADPRGVTL